jgi:hypothetical protein
MAVIEAERLRTVEVIRERERERESQIGLFLLLKYQEIKECILPEGFAFKQRNNSLSN